MGKKNIFRVLARILIWLAVFFIIWLILYVSGISLVLGIMYLNRANPKENLGLGWMAVMLLVPVFCAIVSLIITPVTLRKFRKKKNKGKDLNENKTS